MNHIRYMVARALSGEKLKVNMNDYMEVKFPKSFGMAQAVCDQVGESLGVKLDIWRCILKESLMTSAK